MSEYLIAVILGIVEGLTEFLPVSSTGHQILVAELLGFTGDKAKVFEVVIQLGAILAVASLFFTRLLGMIGIGKEKSLPGSGRLNLVHLIIACVPAVVLGLTVYSRIKADLWSSTTVLIGLVAGGLFMIFAELIKRPVTTTDVDKITYRQAFWVGIAQCLALWPGFSRAGSTIAGGLLAGVNHKAAADFSFLIAVPMMVSASGYDLYKNRDLLEMGDMGWFAVGFVVSYFVALLAVRTFVGLLKKVKLTPFAIYRFVLAAVFYFFLMA